MTEPMSVKDAIKEIEFEMGSPCVAQGFDQREFGSKMVSVLYYSLLSRSGKPRYRVQVFVDGHRDMGTEI